MNFTSSQPIPCDGTEWNGMEWKNSGDKMSHSQKSKLLIFIFLNKKFISEKKKSLVSGDLTINPAEDPEQGF